MGDVDALRRAYADANARKIRADAAARAARDEWNAADRAARRAEQALTEALRAQAFDAVHPQLFAVGDDHQDQAADYTRHEPDPDPPDPAPYDTCRKCRRAIRHAPELAAWVTTVSRNPECYGRRP